MNQLAANQQDVQTRPREITTQAEILTKSLAELAEEVLGLNGTFASVLRPKTAQPTGSSDRTATTGCQTEAARMLEGMNDHIQATITEVRSLRERCEL